MIRRDRSDRDSSRCPRRRRSRARTCPSRRRTHRPPQARSSEFDPKTRSTRLAVHRTSPFVRQHPSNESAASNVGFHCVPMSRRLTSARREALAWSGADHGDDPHRDPGKARWQTRGPVGTLRCGNEITEVKPWRTSSLSSEPARSVSPARPSREAVHTLVDKATGIGEITGLVHAASVSPSQASPETILHVDLYGTSVGERDRARWVGHCHLVPVWPPATRPHHRTEPRASVSILPTVRQIVHTGRRPACSQRSAPSSRP
jgi:hypothetical protein